MCMSQREMNVGSETDPRRVEWMRFSDRKSVRPVPLPRSLAYLKREISEGEARQWAGGRVNNKKCNLLSNPWPDGTVAPTGLPRGPVR